MASSLAFFLAVAAAVVVGANEYARLMMQPRSLDKYSTQTVSDL